MSSIEFFEELKQRLADCQIPDETTRKAGEDEVRRMRDENVHKFFATLIKEIADESNPDTVRQMACIVGKNLISVRQIDQHY
mmetsp:Transcript_41566/g.54735  ORF Transcript_41566/g.54735 Transcript_41566/m.54735 type:complete len:82 (+) Transcript_41566:104-349(+)